MKIVIMGLTASGKTTQARRIADEYGLWFVRGSSLLLHKLNAVEDDESHYWFDERGRALDEARNTSSVDRDVDQHLLDVVRNCNRIISDSWTLAWLYPGTDLIRIYLTAGIESRARRARGSKAECPYSLPELKKFIGNKDSGTRDRFHQLYGIDIFQVAGFDLVLDTDRLGVESVTKILRAYLSEVTTYPIAQG